MDEDYMNGTELLKAIDKADNVYGFIQTTNANWSVVKLDKDDIVREVKGIAKKKPSITQFKARRVGFDIYIG